MSHWQVAAHERPSAQQTPQLDALKQEALSETDNSEVHTSAELTGPNRIGSFSHTSTRRLMHAIVSFLRRARKSAPRRRSLEPCRYINRDDALAYRARLAYQLA